MRENWWKYLLGVWMAVIIVAAFLFTPTAKGLGQTTRVLYFHVPSAWVTTLAFFISAIFSVLYLMKHKPEQDIRAEAAAQIGLIFAILTTVTDICHFNHRNRFHLGQGDLAFLLELGSAGNLHFYAVADLRGLFCPPVCH